MIRRDFILPGRRKKQPTNTDKNEQIMIEDRSYGKAELAMLYFPTATPQGSAQPAGEMDQPVPRAQAEPLFGLRWQVFPLLHPAASGRNHRISG